MCDFGLSRKLSGGLADGLNSMQGTPKYMAPELLRRLRAPETLCNEPVTPQMDVYSFGVVAWELFTGQEPWKGFTVKLMIQMMELQKTNLLEVTPLDDGVGALIARCLDYDPNLRPCFSEIVHVLRVRHARTHTHTDLTPPSCMGHFSCCRGGARTDMDFGWRPERGAMGCWCSRW